MTTVSIRLATPADIPAITRIYALAVENGTASFEIEAPDRTEMARRQRELIDAGFPYIAAEFGGTLLGYAYVARYRLRPAYRFTVEDSIYVDPGAQRRGVGRKLLEHLVAESAGRGFRQMIAVIGDSAQSASIELHRAAGFRMVGTLESVGHKFGRWLDSVMMQRALGPGATAQP
jgi:L-amino acid N-acyltransferase YncA